MLDRLPCGACGGLIITIRYFRTFNKPIRSAIKLQASGPTERLKTVVTHAHGGVFQSWHFSYSVAPLC
jgi:hypothetical protein